MKTNNTIRYVIDVQIYMCAVGSFTRTVNVVNFKKENQNKNRKSQPAQKAWLSDGNKLMRNIRTLFTYSVAFNATVDWMMFRIAYGIRCIYRTYITYICAPVERALLSVLFRVYIR